MAGADHDQKMRKQARVAFKKGQYEEAVSYYHQLLAERSEAIAADQESQDRMEYGTALFRVSRFAEAEREFEASLVADPSNASVLHKLGLIHMRLGRPQKALEAFRGAAHAAPGEAAYQWAHAEVALALGERAEAEAALNASLALDPENEEAKAAKRQLEHQPEAAFGKSSVTDEDFAGLLEFIRSRPTEEAPPVRAVDTSFRPLLYVFGGAVLFIVLFLYVRIVMIG